MTDETDELGGELMPVLIEAKRRLMQERGIGHTDAAHAFIGYGLALLGEHSLGELGIVPAEIEAKGADRRARLT